MVESGSSQAKEVPESANTWAEQFQDQQQNGAAWANDFQHQNLEEAWQERQVGLLHLVALLVCCHTFQRFWPTTWTYSAVMSSTALKLLDYASRS